MWAGVNNSLVISQKRSISIGLPILVIDFAFLCDNGLQVTRLCLWMTALSLFSFYSYRVRWKWSTGIGFVDVGPCKDSFKVVSGYVALPDYSIMPIKGVQSMEDCEARCLVDKECEGFSWVTETKPYYCELYNQKANNIMKDDNVAHVLYIRERCGHFSG